MSCKSTELCNFASIYLSLQPEAKSNEHSTDGPKYYSNPKMERLTKLKSLLKYGLNNHAKMIVFKLVAIASFESTTCLLVIKMCYDFSTGKSRFGSFIRNMN
jgi:hypothetical protein